MQTRIVRSIIVVVLALLSSSILAAQDKGSILTGQALTRVVPTSFYFEGQSAPTQMRNSAAASLGRNRNVIAGLVDTSGYSSEVRTKYEGFLITDSEIEIGGKKLATGAYGFGFTNDGKLNVFDIGGRQVLSVDVTNDRQLSRPRPLMMSLEGGDRIRLYAGRRFAVIRAA